MKADEKTEARRPLFLAGTKFDAAVDEMQKAMFAYSGELEAERSKAMK
jgi:hypothetical protein